MTFYHISEAQMVQDQFQEEERKEACEADVEEMKSNEEDHSLHQQVGKVQ